MKRKVTLLSACAAFLLAGTTVWGQSGVLLPQNQGQPEVTPRRVTSPGSTLIINGAPDANNEFGAGESMKIKPNIHAGQEVALPWSVLPATLTKYDQATMGSTIPSSAYTASPKFGTKVVPWANAYSTTTSSSLLYSPIKDIRLGSTNSRNVVIKTYTGDGFAMGWATVVRSKNTITAVDPSSYSNIESSISTFDTIPTVVADISNAMMAFTFSKYTYRYFAAKEGSPFEVDNSTPRWDNNYNPWNATSSGLTGKSFEHPYISTTHTNHLNHLISDTVSLSTCCKSALFNMVWYSNPTTGGGYIWVWHHDGNGLNNLYVNHTYGGTSPNDLKVSDFRPGGAFWNKRTEVKPSAISTAYYTTTIDSFYTRKWGQYYFNNDGETKLSYPVDDSIALVQFSGTPMRDAEALKKQNVIGFVSDAAVPGGDHDADTIYGGGGASKIANYKRPTTVLLETGEHEFDNFEIGDIKWYYERNQAEPHQTSGGYFTYCCAGKMYGYTFDPEWSPSNEEGKTLIDGAIVLKNDARVYLDKDIADATTSAAETRKDETEATITDPTYPFPDKETAALLVVADSVKAGFTLRTLGNYNKLNIYQQNMDKPDDSLFYRQATFPLPNQHVYLFEGASQFKYANKALTGYANGGAVNISAPATEGGGSVFGVFGDYIYDNDAADKLNAQIHTAWGDPSQATPTILKKDNPGVIEIGTGITDSIGTPLTVTGYKNFFVYSGGTLKNFEKMPWSMHGRTHNFAMNFTTDENTPNFVINGDAPLLIANYGSNCSLIECNDAEQHICDADIYFETAGSDKLFSTTGALGTASDSGSLQVQARGDVIFANPVSIINFVRPNEVRILSDEATIQFNDDFTYNNSMDSDLVIWAKGNEGLRSCLDGNCGGYVHFAKIADLKQQKRGFTLIRSENDDVYMDDEFKYTNTANGIDNGEFIMQAGQDVYGKDVVELNSAGQKSMLMEAKHTINLEKDLKISKTVATATKDSVTLKAGYDNFSSSAVVAEWTPAAGYACTLRDLTGYANPTYTYYGSRNACQWTEGGDIWLQGPVNIDYTTAPIDSVTTILRAFNSIYFDDKLDFSRTASGDSVINEKSVGGQGQTMLFAETGNIEAIKGSSKDLTFTMGNDSSLLTIQAGNMIGNECAAPTQFNCWVKNGNSGAEYDGNILFNNKLNVTSTGTGNFLMSSARDIETQTSGDLTITYTEPGLKSGDVLITAGRHVETHAPATFNYSGLNDTAKITIQAGRINDYTYICSDTMCKVAEYGTQLTDKNDATLAYDPANVTTTNGGSTVDNEFAKGGMGHGSILAFKNMEFNYKGVDTILMTALNGNIESDPYLHTPNTYNTGNALIRFNHEGNGITRMEAIDIKLHDALEYNGTHHASDSNGWFYMAAFDSILTRNITYVNQTDKGSVSITTDKIKMIGNALCEESIRQGHIVLGYGADCSSANTNDQILFDMDNNPNTVGANILIEAGVKGFDNRTDYKKKLYGGNITFDYMLIKPAVGNHTAGGYTKIHTPNGNIWGKDSLTYIGHEGDLLVDAGIGSADDNEAIRWNAGDAFGEGTAMQTNGHLENITNAFPNGSENTLNTRIPNNCNGNFQWRTGNIMMKGGSLTYPTNEGGYATFRTRAGYIDLYDKFDVSGMTGQLLVYAHSEAVANDTIKQYSDVSTRDFHYEPSPSGASVYFGADDNIMFNYGNSNGTQDYTPSVPCAATGVYAFDYDGTRNNLHNAANPFYSTSYKTNIDECRSIFNVNTNGYQWYNQWSPDDLLGDGDPYIWKNHLHMLYRGGKRSCNKSGITGTCETPSNGARDIEMNFSSPRNGGFAAVANNYIDFFTKFTYIGGQGNGLENPSVGSIVGESVTGYGLYLKSRYQGAQPERRRITCFMCTPEEWPYVGFHDDARIHTENQKSLIEGPVIEFFGHAELDSYTQNNGNGKISLKGDSLIFHDSAIFDGTNLDLLPFTTDASARANNFRYGVMNDKNANKFYKEYGMAIQMTDRGTPVLELGYQRCNEPSDGVHKAPNTNSKAGKESTPLVGGDVIVAFKNGFSLPIYNTVVANHARISFVSDSLDGPGGEYVDTYIRTDLLRIRNKVEFYTGEGTSNDDPKNRRGVFKMSSHEYMDEVEEAGIYPHHLHMEPGSELSIPSEDSLIVYATTTVGGYGNIHENIFVKANGTIAPGYASLMEEDCCTPHGQGRLTVHNLTMEKDAIFRVSIGRYNQCYDEDGKEDGKNKNCTGTDVLQVEDSIFFNGKIPLHILLEGDKDLDAVLDPGCYLFLEYNDSLGNSKEYVKNFTLPIDRYQDNYFGLDYSTPGKVYLCVMQFPQPVVERYVKLPAVEGVTTTPNAGTHYVTGHQNFSFTAKYSGTPLKVTATGYYHGGPVDLDQTATILPDGSYQYTIMQVVQPYDVEFGPETSSVQVGNDYMGAPLVYAYKNILHINVEKEDIVSIYNMTGVLYRKIDVPAGNSKFTLDKGMYIVTLKDGSVHKIVIK